MDERTFLGLVCLKLFSLLVEVVHRRAVEVDGESLASDLVAGLWGRLSGRRYLLQVGHQILEDGNLPRRLRRQILRKVYQQLRRSVTVRCCPETLEPCDFSLADEQEVTAFVDSLPGDLRRVVRLILEGRQHKEIAECLGVSVRTVGNRVRRIRQVLGPQEDVTSIEGG